MDVIKLVQKMFGASASQPGGGPSDPLNHLDVAFIVDTTASMGPFIDAARQHMLSMLRRLTGEVASPIDLRLAIVEYRDHPPQERSFVAREHAFRDALGVVEKVILGLRPAGGGDEPEAVYDGIEAACRRLQWRPHSRRAAILIGDAVPHGWSQRGGVPQGTCACGLTADAATALLEESRIVLYALGLTASVDSAFTWLARATGGTYFAAHRGQDAMSALEALLTREFADLDFDRRTLVAQAQNQEATVDDLALALGSPPGRVATSLTRLGRRGMLNAEKPGEAVAFAKSQE